MVTRPIGLGAYEFAVLSGLRAAQLMRGSTPRVGGEHKSTVMAQMEVAELKVRRVPKADLEPVRR